MDPASSMASSSSSTPIQSVTKAASQSDVVSLDDSSQPPVFRTISHRDPRTKFYSGQAHMTPALARAMVTAETRKESSSLPAPSPGTFEEEPMVREHRRDSSRLMDAFYEPLAHDIQQIRDVVWEMVQVPIHY